MALRGDAGGTWGGFRPGQANMAQARRELQAAHPFPAAAAPGNPMFIQTPADQQAYEAHLEQARVAAQEAARAMQFAGMAPAAPQWGQQQQIVAAPKAKGKGKGKAQFWGKGRAGQNSALFQLPQMVTQALHHAR